MYEVLSILNGILSFVFVLNLLYYERRFIENLMFFFLNFSNEVIRIDSKKEWGMINMSIIIFNHNYNLFKILVD